MIFSNYLYYQNKYQALHQLTCAFPFLQSSVFLNQSAILRIQVMEKRQRPKSLEKEQEKQRDEEIQENETQSKSKKLSSLLTPKITNFKSYDQSKQKALPRQFFRQEVVDLAKALLGKVFVRKMKEGVIKAVIVETEAYKAPEDQGCHAFNNKKTQKTKYFWLDGGSLYIYTIYMPTNICLNVVAGEQGQPEAVLIRAVQPIQGIDLMKSIRNVKSPKIQDLCNGPGKVGQSLGIKKDEMNGMDLLDGQFKIVDAGLSNFSMGVTRRVNIDYAGEWIWKPWRFFVQGNTFVSKVKFEEPKIKQKGSSKSTKK